MVTSSTRFLAGETIHVSADGLTARLGGEITDGASVTLSIADQYDADVVTQTVTEPDPDTNDWGADLRAPDLPGSYFVKASATKDGATWRAKERIVIASF